MIKVLFVDVDDTILDFYECARISLKDCFEENGFAYQDHYFDVFMQENEKLWRQIEKAELDLKRLHYLRFRNILAHLGLTGDGDVLESCFVRNLNGSHVLVEGAKETLAYLAKRYTLFITSNAPLAEQVGRLKAAGILDYFKEVFASSDIGYSKPDKRFFEECLKRAGADWDEVMVIGDSLTSDIAGARNAGLNFIWFNLRNNLVPDDLEGKTVHQLSELKKLL